MSTLNDLVLILLILGAFALFAKVLKSVIKGCLTVLSIIILLLLLWLGYQFWRSTKEIVYLGNGYTIKDLKLLGPVL